MFARESQFGSADSSICLLICLLISWAGLGASPGKNSSHAARLPNVQPTDSSLGLRCHTASSGQVSSQGKAPEGQLGRAAGHGRPGARRARNWPAAGLQGPGHMVLLCGVALPVGPSLRRGYYRPVAGERDALISTPGALLPLSVLKGPPSQRQGMENGQGLWCPKVLRFMA